MPRHPPCALTHLTTTRCSHPLCNTQHTTTPHNHRHHHTQNPPKRENALDAQPGGGTEKTPPQVSPQDPTACELIPPASTDTSGTKQQKCSTQPHPTRHQQPPAPCLDQAWNQ